jgi:hypothetical protein
MTRSFIPQRGPTYADNLRRSRPRRERLRVAPRSVNVSGGSSLASVSVAGDERLPILGEAVDATGWKVTFLTTSLQRTNRELTVRLKRFVPPPPEASWLDAAEHQLVELFREAEADADAGWVAIEPRTLDLAMHLVRTLASVAPAPDLGRGRRGQITLDWWGDLDSTLSVEVLPEGRIIFSSLDDQNRGRRGDAGLPDGSQPPAALEFELAQLFRANVAHS